MSTDRLAQELLEHLRVMESLKILLKDIHTVANQCSQAIDEGNKIFFCGNGGSASDSQHLATELIGRFKNNRRPLAALSLVGGCRPVIQLIAVVLPAPLWPSKANNSPCFMSLVLDEN